MEFVPFPKMPRLRREVVITEKIDGTNASVLIAGIRPDEFNPVPHHAPVAVVGDLGLWPASRRRWISTENDNYGFAAWVRENAQELVRLGAGHHFGEWWGRGIQRHYDLQGRRWSLFNLNRWVRQPVAGVAELSFSDRPLTEGQRYAPACCDVVPELYRGPITSGCVDRALYSLQQYGSVAAPRFMNPEGVVLFHSAANQLFKVTLRDDDEPKSKSELKRRSVQAGAKFDEVYLAAQGVAV